MLTTCCFKDPVTVRARVCWFLDVVLSDHPANIPDWTMKLSIKLKRLCCRFLFSEERLAVSSQSKNNDHWLYNSNRWTGSVSLLAASPWTPLIYLKQSERQVHFLKLFAPLWTSHNSSTSNISSDHTRIFSPTGQVWVHRRADGVCEGVNVWAETGHWCLDRRQKH